MNILLFALIYFSGAEEVATKICIFHDSVPDICRNIEKIDASKISNLDNAVKGLLTRSTVVIFEPVSSFSYQLSLNTFNKMNINFTSSDKTKLFQLNLIVSQQLTSSLVLFENSKVKFIGEKSGTSLQLDRIDFINCDLIQFDSNMKKSLMTHAAIFDSVENVIAFSDITIKGGFRNPDLTISSQKSETLKMELKDNQLNLNEGKTNVVFSNAEYRRVEVVGLKHVDVSNGGDSVDVNKLSIAVFRNISEVSFLNGKHEYPASYVIECHEISKIYSNIPSLPISIYGEKMNTDVMLTQSTGITGDIEVENVTFYALNPDKNRVMSMISGHLSSHFLILKNSSIDIAIKDLRIPLDPYPALKYDPFIHCLGRYGVSTITAYTNQKGLVSFNKPLFNRDFGTYLEDSELSKLISTTGLTYLSIISNNAEGLESLVSPRIKYTADLTSASDKDAMNTAFVHGFSEKSSVCTLRRSPNTESHSISDSIIVSKPSEKAVKLSTYIYVSDGQLVTKDDLKDLAKSGFVLKGMKRINIVIDADIPEIDLSSSSLFAQTNITIESRLYSAFSHNFKINSLKLPSAGINITLINIELPDTFSADLASITLLKSSTSYNCHISLTDRTNLTIDTQFLMEKYFDHIKDTRVNVLAIQIDLVSQITLLDTGFKFALTDRPSDPYTISTVIWNSIEFRRDIYLYRTLEIEANQRFPKFNITIGNSDTRILDVKTFSLKLSLWTQISSTEKSDIFLNHFEFPVEITLTEPAYIDPIKLFGDGKVTYKTMYMDAYDICACDDKDYTQFPICSRATRTVLFKELPDELSKINANNLTVYIANSTSSKRPEITLDLLNKREINFIGEKKEEFIFIKLDSSKGNIKDPKLTTTHFHNFTILTSTSNSDSENAEKEYLFGELNLINSKCDSSQFKEVTIRVDDLFCDVNFFSNFKDIYITDNLVVRGDFSNASPKTIHFVNDDDAEDLKVVLEHDNTVIKVGNNQIIIGQLTFMIERSNVFDIVLNISDNLNVVFQSDPSSSTVFEKMPLVQINPCDGVSFDLTNNGQSWPSIPVDYKEKNFKFVFCFVGISDAKITLSSENVPIKVGSIEKESKIIVSKTKKASITSSLSNSLATLDLEVTSTSLGEACEMIIPELNIYEEFSLKVLSPSMKMTFNEVNNMNIDGTYKNIKVSLYVGFDGQSSIYAKVVTNDLIKIDSNVQILLNTKNVVDLTDRELVSFISKNYTLVHFPLPFSGSSQSTSSFYFKPIAPIPTTHGVSSAFAIIQDPKNLDIILYTKTRPEDVKLMMCYASYFTCESQVEKEAQLKDLTSLIPKGLKSLEIRIGANLVSSDTFINLDLASFETSNKMSVYLIGEQMPDLPISLGQNRIGLLNIDNVRITEVKDKNTFKAKKLSITGALIADVKGFEEIDVTDQESWRQKSFTEFPNKISIVSSEKKVTFNNEGWIIGASEKVLSSKFPNLVVNFIAGRDPATSALEIAKDGDDIKKLTINVKNKNSIIRNFVLSQGWQTSLPYATGSIVVINGLSAEENTDEITVRTSSFPFDIQPLSTSPLSVIHINSDVAISPDHFTLYNQHMTIDLSDFQPISQDNTNGKNNDVKLLMNIVELKNSSITIRNGDSTTTKKVVQVNQLITSEKSLITSVDIQRQMNMKGESVFEGDISFAKEAVIEYLWDLDETPEISFTEYPSSVEASQINIRFARTTLSSQDIDAFNEFLYLKVYRFANFGSLCDDYAKKVTFNSTVSYFSSERPDENVLLAYCNDGELLFGSRTMIPKPDGGDDDDGGKKGMKGWAIALLTIGLIVGGAGVAYLAFFFYKRYKAEKGNLTSVLLATEKEDSYTNAV